MATSNDDLIAASGRVDFPRSLNDLMSTAQCPACFSPLRSTMCGTCGLNLEHPAAAELAERSASIAESLRGRLAIIGRMRLESRAAVAAVTVAAVTPALATAADTPIASAAAHVAAAPVAAHVAVATPAAGVVPNVPAPDSPASRHLGVQVILLIVGISLLSVGAIFFLVYAFITFGLVWRSLIIGTVTLVAILAASALRRRSLYATSEGIGILAIVFVYLDVFAVRANDLFGAASRDEAEYWGAALIGSAVGFLVWHRIARIRAASIAAFAALPIGLFILTASFTDGAPFERAIFLSFCALAIGSAIYAISGTPLAVGARRIEQITALALAVIGTVGVAIAAFGLEPDWEWGGALGFAIAGSLSFAHGAIIRRVRAPRIFDWMFVGLGAASFASIAFAVALRSDAEWVAVIAPVVWAVIVALVFEALRRVIAAVSAGVVAAVLAVVPVVFALGLALAYPALAVVQGVWSVPGAEAVTVESRSGYALVAIGAVVGIACAFWALRRVLARRATVVLAALIALAVVSVGLVGTLWAAIIAWIVIAVVGVAVLLAAARGRWSAFLHGAGIRSVVNVGAGVALFLAYAASWASIDTWWVGSLAAVSLVVAARFAVASAAIRGALTGTAIVLALMAVGAEGWHLNERFLGGADASLEAAQWILVLAVLALAVSVFTPRLANTDRQVAQWVTVPVIALTAAASWGITQANTDAANLVFAVPVVGVLAGSALVAVLLVRARSQNRELANEAGFAAAAAPIALAWTVDSGVALAGGDDAARALITLVAVGAVYVAASVVGTSRLGAAVPQSQSVRISALVLASVLAAYGIVLAGIDPIELATASLAVALFAVGAIRLRTVAAAGSWRWLAPGLIVLLVPSLFVTFVDQELWRLVALGVAAVAAVVVGALARLQAPLVIGAVVAVVHGLRTFAPQLLAVYQLAEWWVWAVIGGAIVLFVAITFERRTRDLKKFGAQIGSFR